MKTKQQIQAAYSGALFEVARGDHTFFFRKPTYPEWRRVQALITTAKISKDGESALLADEELVKACCLSHTPDELERLVQDGHYSLYGACSSQLGPWVTAAEAAFATKSGAASPSHNEAKS